MSNISAISGQRRLVKSFVEFKFSTDDEKNCRQRIVDKNKKEETKPRTEELKLDKETERDLKAREPKQRPD